MRVGVNYPWFDYGWDFGLGPRAWRGERASPRWYDAIDDHLRHFQRLGIGVVRWFVLADGLTYGIDANAPVPDLATPGGWRFDPPPLRHECLEHFDELLRRFATARADGRQPIQLLPVLIDFRFCGPGTRPVSALEPSRPDGWTEGAGWVKQGRAEAVIDSVKRQQFLDHVLDPLLRISGRYGDVIYAWELINEPDWVTRGWHSRPFIRPPVPDDAMRAFLEDGAKRVRAAGFKPTVGFGSARTLRRSGTVMDVNQFHHYPGGARWLDCDPIAQGIPSVIGEFATATIDVWPDMPLRSQRVLDRLLLARSLGCSLAIPWSFLARDPHTDWSAAVERDIEAFTGGESSDDQ